MSCCPHKKSHPFRNLNFPNTLPPSKFPSRVAFFSWTAAWGKILSIDNLRKRGMLILDWCYMCKKCRETVKPTSILSYSLGPVDFGVLFIWLPLGYANERVIDMFATWQGPFGNIEILLFGKLCHIALYGVFGKNGILEVLRDVNGIS